jgi:hypothetical protein
MTRAYLTCDYCDRSIRDCICITTVETHSRYCDGCGRAKQYCTCCGGCRKPTDECECHLCSKCKREHDKCVCVCRGCSYVGAACRCYEGVDEEPHPDTLCCAHCYSDPCECDKVAEQKDRNRMADETCAGCDEHYKRCACRRKDRAYDSEDD